MIRVRLILLSLSFSGLGLWVQSIGFGVRGSRFRVSMVTTI